MLRASIFLFVVFGTTGTTRAQQVERVIGLQADSVPLRIWFGDGGDETWARYVLSASDAYLRAAEDYLGRSLGAADTIRIAGGREVYRDGRWVGGYSDPAARAAFLQYDISLVHDPALLYHELSHFWIAEGATDQAWLMEGIASFLAIAMDAAGYEIPDAHAAWNHWGFRHLGSYEDLPTHTDFRARSRSSFLDWYRKTFRIQYLIFSELGAVRYRRFVSDLVSRGPVRGLTPVLEMLYAHKAMDWPRFLSGWVMPGPYRQFSLEDFLDQDHDGLFDIEEHHAGTDPSRPDSDDDGVPDGAELRLGSAPLRPDASTASRLGPFIDGSGEEWDRLPAREVRDRANDSTGDSSLDLVRLKYLVRDGTLFVLVETAGTPTARSGVFFDVLRDADLDHRSDGDFAFWLDHPTAPWYYVRDEMVLVPGLESAVGDVIEMAIPLEQLGTGTVQILPIFRNDTTKSNYDEWDSWIRIERN